MSRANMVSSAGFCYAADTSANNPAIHIQTHLAHQVAAGYESNPDPIFNLSTGIEMIGFPKHHQSDSLDHHHHHHNSTNTSNSMLWKGFFGKSSTSPSSSKATTTINETTSEYFQHHHHQQQQQQYEKPDFATSENMLVVDDSSLRCVFPCEGNERPSQGLSLSLSSSNPSSIGLQSFELRDTNNNPSQPQEQHDPDDHTKDGFFFGKAVGIQQQMVQDGNFFLKGSSSSNFHHHQQGQFQFRNSKYLGPAQELLNEFCSLGSFQNDPSQKQKNQKSKSSWEDDNNGSTSSGSSKQQSLYSLDFMELQKRKSKLLSMLDEVDRRYKHYCDQMKAVVSSFEAVAGDGAAKVYSTLASKAMSRHFRCLRDGIVGQIQATKKAMGEKDSVSPGASRGETPRLRILDQALRQQRAFQQMSMMENHPWRPQRGLPERSVSILRAWLFEHFLHPYPSDVDKHILARQTGLSRSQVSNWFINARVRLWKPMVEEMYLEETKEQDHLGGSSDGMTDIDEIGQSNRTGLPVSIEDQKPSHDQLVRINSECLSSIITSPDNKNGSKSNRNPQNYHLQHHRQQPSFGYNGMELDFSSYGNNAVAAGTVSYANDPSNNQNFNRGGGVSLTLGLQQHEGSSGGVSLAFSPTSQSSLFYPRDSIEDCQTVQYSLLDGEAQNLPYRNLMGAQLLHDLAG